MRMKFKSLVLPVVLALGGCTYFTEAPEAAQEESGTLRIYAGLPQEEPQTKLTYHETLVSGRTALKTLWSEDDMLVATPTPSNEDNSYVFTLVEGKGTTRGTFECRNLPNGYLPENFTSNGWTIYFPGSKIQGEGDYLNFTYEGQVQEGNGSMTHLKDFHSIRLLCTDGSKTTFKDSYIDFYGEGVEESSCMKFDLSGLPSTIPSSITLSYSAPSGYESTCFSTHNRLDSWWTGSYSVNMEQTSKLSLSLKDFDQTTSVTAYMMMSNYPAKLKSGGTLKVTVTAEDGTRYVCEKPLAKDVTLNGGRLHTITCTTWKEISYSGLDGFDDPVNGVTVLQEATIGNGTDIIIMGDGFAADKVKDGTYAAIMTKAYNDFFSVEPYRSLKPYFNVYYINAVSADNHDAEPYFDAYGNQNGAVNGSASTVFETEFSPGSTNITGDDNTALEYAAQAIKSKGGKNGTPCTDALEVAKRVATSLMMVMCNVNCHAGTCALVWTIFDDYCQSYSVAYTALGNSEEEGRWTTIHEAGGHGFGKLGDEYSSLFITGFGTGEWTNLKNRHNYGLYRNINEYWGPEEREDGWTFTRDDTTTGNVYWKELFNGYGYEASEGLGIYRGAYTYTNLFCRPTENSIMRNQYASDGKYFNAISRWAIWYRLMRLTGSTSARNFKASLDEFIAFDKTITINTPTETRSFAEDDGKMPLAAPVLIQGEWINGRLTTR